MFPHLPVALMAPDEPEKDSAAFPIGAARGEGRPWP
jgi:hypothetical protein